MDEKNYKSLGWCGGFNIAIGVISIVMGIAAGVILIVSGAKVLSAKNKMIF